MFPRGGGEQFEGVPGHRAIVPGALDGVFQGAVLLHCRQRELESRQLPRPFPMSGARIRALASRRAGRQRHRQGDLSLAEIIADILAELGRRAAVVERVVDELKGDAEICAVALAGGDLRLGAAGENGPTSQAAANNAAVLARMTAR